jgi:tRNA-Thr(GGU) m(6)t(6)A37 methyltransferase TsaA
MLPDMSMPPYSLTPIAHLRSPFKQKFAIPRQPNLANAPGTLIFTPEFTDINALRGIELYSHLWLLFIFHETLQQGWKPTVKAPRLGGNKKLGVFASRSTFRPNGIGMSVVQYQGMKQKNGQLELHISGIDLLDGTPIVDIKPYIPYADNIPTATADWLNQHPINKREVNIGPQVTNKLQQLARKYPDLPDLINACLSQDPRPAYKHALDNDDKLYHVNFYDVDIHWCVKNGKIEITSINEISDS